MAIINSQTLPIAHMHLTEIFKRLDFENLLSCRLVCKRWKEILFFFPLKHTLFTKNSIGKIFPFMFDVTINEISVSLITSLDTTLWLKNISIRHITQKSCDLLGKMNLNLVTTLELYFSNSTYLNVNNMQSLKRLSLYDFPALQDDGFICVNPTLRELKLSSIPFLAFKKVKHITPYLKRLELTNTPLVNKNTFSQFTRFVQLKHLSINDNEELTDNALQGTLQNANIIEMTISDCPLLHGKCLSTFPPLEKLNLTFNRALDFNCIETYNFLEKLTSLDLFGSSVSRLPEMPKLKRLSIGYTEVKTSMVSKLQTLKSLDVTYLKLTDEMLDGIAAIKGIITLNLSFNTSLSDIGLQKIINNCTKLQGINLARCTLLTSHTLSTLTKITSLKCCVLPNFLKVNADRIWNSLAYSDIE
ncbi:F-box/leucine rich repeat protein, putative [Entamoeba invadens IP1]|uniref:F-box/leucine rich repeat protein, putative n=1 Tax=Entamoeba invadens IP1 TaxID=370355 RepID=A0A0A1U6Q3_ENTIV|nr:F-box/leucine rich repeat protein, putative [Entamoeba invadens IP1]ELP87506.1 F-box/leucine rich repeat protein, putative [Entamoeba invadens IP1]|eukprot:XP_004254277.1 F-box/leucine rich repeat protein, putative [Entamoeba invadens IP1]